MLFLSVLICGGGIDAPAGVFIYNNVGAGAIIALPALEDGRSPLNLEMIDNQMAENFLFKICAKNSVNIV